MKQTYTAQESVAPYGKAIAVVTGTVYEPCRAVYTVAQGNHVLTVDGREITFTGMVVGKIYPICATEVGANGSVIFLY